MQEMQETRVQSLDQKNTMEKEMAIDSSILAWKIPCLENSMDREPSRLQSTVLQSQT